MNFELTDEQQLIQDAGKEFADNVLGECWEQIETTNDIPDEVIQQAADARFMGIPYPEEIGGEGGTLLDFVLVLEQIARWSGAFASVLGNNNLGLNCIRLFGNEEQKAKYIPDCLSLKQISSFAFTEPSTGSDPKSIETTAVLDGDSWVLNGQKRFISLANYHGPLVVFAKDDQSGIPSAFIMDKFCEGYGIDNGYSKIGLHGAMLNDIFLDDVRVPKENIILGPGKGFMALTGNIAFGKLVVATIALGRAAGALERAVQFSHDRTRRGVPIASYPTLQYRIADMAAYVEAMRTAVYRLAWIGDNVSDLKVVERESAKTKIVVCNQAVRVCEQAVQVCGSYGLTSEYRVEGMLRDCVLCNGVEGVDDVQHVIVAHSMGIDAPRKAK